PPGARAGLSPRIQMFDSAAHGVTRPIIAIRLATRNHRSQMRLGYLYSRYPLIWQTLWDAERLALERRGIELVIGSVYPPLTSLRHEYIARLSAPIHYAPPQEILKILERNAKNNRKWPRHLVEEHEGKYGPTAK